MLSPSSLEQASPRRGAGLGKSSRANPLAARKSLTAKSSESLAPATFSRARSVLNLPNEIGFLVHYGISSARLANAAETAREQGVTADLVLIAEGQISEDSFYRALARYLRLTFTDADIILDAATPYVQAIEAGAVALPPGHDAAFLMAPRGAAISRLIAALSRRGPITHIALTTPSHLSQLVRQAAGSAIARAASFDLLNFDANFCAKGGINASQGVALAALGCIAAFFLPLAPAGSTTFYAAIFSVFLLATFWLRLSACALSPKPRPPSSPMLSDAELPVYSVVIALYREAEVVPQLLAGIEAFDYPRAKLDVKFVIEQNDHETFEAFQRLDMPSFCEVIVAPPGAPQTKPRALNVALPLVRGELLAVYDAEDIPDPQQLRLAASRFAEAPAQLACIQGQLVIDNINDGWLPKLFAIEYAALFDLLNPGLAAMGIQFPLGGTSNHFRTDALRRVGGWDAWNVTEDADVGFRLARFGYKSETLTSPTYEEAPITLPAFFKQRRRWCKGFYQTLIVLWRQPRRLVREMGLARSATLSLVLVANMLGSMTAPLSLTTVGAYMVLGTKALPANIGDDLLAILWASVMVGAIPTILWPVLKGMRRRKLLHLWPVLFFAAGLCADRLRRGMGCIVRSHPASILLAENRTWPGPPRRARRHDSKMASQAAGSDCARLGISG